MRRASPISLLLAALPALPALSACLASPDGVARAWPPGLATLDVVAVATGDLDGDGAADLIIVSAGTAAHGAGVYLVRGGHDLSPGDAAPIASFTTYQPLAAVAAPAAAQIVTAAGTPTALIAYTVGGSVQITALRGAGLAIAGDHPSDLTVSDGDAIWLSSVTFPGNGTRVVLGAADQIRHFDPADAASTALLTPNVVPGPGDHWSAPRLATSYAAGPDQLLVIATAAGAQRATLPTGGAMMPPTWTWTSVRSGAAWAGQVAADLGNGHADVLGFAPGVGGAAGQLCAFDPAATGTAPCVGTALTAADAQVLTGHVDSGAGIDALIVSRGGGAASVAAVTNLGLTGASLAGSPGGASFATSIVDARAAMLAGAGGVADRALLIGHDGAAACVGLGAGGLGPCQ